MNGLWLARGDLPQFISWLIGVEAHWDAMGYRQNEIRGPTDSGTM